MSVGTSVRGLHTIEGQAWLRVQRGRALRVKRYGSVAAGEDRLPCVWLDRSVQKRVRAVQIGVAEGLVACEVSIEVVAPANGRQGAAVLMMTFDGPADWRPALVFDLPRQGGFLRRVADEGMLLLTLIGSVSDRDALLSAVAVPVDGDKWADLFDEAGIDRAPAA